MQLDLIAYFVDQGEKRKKVQDLWVLQMVEHLELSYEFVHQIVIPSYLIVLLLVLLVCIGHFVQSIETVGELRLDLVDLMLGLIHYVKIYGCSPKWNSDFLIFLWCVTAERAIDE